MSRLEEIVAEVLGPAADEGDDGTGAGAIRTWTSLQHVRIVVAVANEFGIRITPRQARSFRDIEGLRDLLVERGCLS
jgi:acyl carrier protein